MPQSALVSPYALDEGIRGVSFPLQHVFYVLLVCAGYYGGALIGQSLRFPDSHLSLIWPPTAILLAALLLAPSRQWWVFLLAVAPVHIIVQLKDGVPLLGILSQLIGNFGQALLAAISVRYFVKGRLQLDTFSDAYHFCSWRGDSRAFSYIQYCRLSLCVERLGARILVRMARAGFIQRAVHPDDYSADFDGFRRRILRSLPALLDGVMSSWVCSPPVSYSPALLHLVTKPQFRHYSTHRFPFCCWRLCVLK